LIVLARHPRPDVRGTVAKHNTPAGFVLSQETDGVTICEDQIGKVQHKDTAGRLCVDYLGQLVHIVSVKLAADHEHNGSGARAMNSQHRPRCSTAIAGPTAKFLKSTGISQTW